MTTDTSAGTSGGLDPATQRTAVFLAAGGLLLLLGWAVQPRFKPAEVKPAAERVLFPKLTDVQEAASLEMLQYDEELATLYPFKVVKTGGVWVLPSHQNYPADAKDHLAAAATELVDLKTLDVVSESPGDHEVYGVIEPDREKIKPGMTGIGQLIEIRDASGSKLARLVVGKEDKQPGVAAAGSRKLRFVRKAGQDPVYRVEIDTSKFTTKFDDWIEKDLLKLTPWDVRRVEIDNYTLAAVESGGRLRVEQQRDERMRLAYDDKGSKWTLTSLEIFPEGQQPMPSRRAAGWGDDEELVSAALNDLRNAVGDLKIVDVARKPAGLSANLEAEETFTKDLEAVGSLRQRGFLPLQSGEILSTEGQTVVGMKDGVEYVLRFGAGTTVAEPGKAEAESDTDEVAAAGEISARYLLVMARFNKDLLEKPDLEDLPPLPEEKTVTQPADAEKPDAEKPDAEKPDAEKPDAEKPDAEKPDEPSAAELLKQADEAEVAMQAAIESRRRVERENRRKQEAYDEKIDAGQKRVRELNGRFADWYYIVSEDEFKKIHLDREKVIAVKESDQAEAGKEAGAE